VGAALAAAAAARGRREAARMPPPARRGGGRGGGPALNFTVRSDGSGDFASVGAALAFCNASGDADALGHVTLHLLGTFYERVEIPPLFPAGVTLIGDGARAEDALVVFDRGGAAGNFTTWFAHTLLVAATDVTLVNVAIANNASGYDAAIAGQAPALHLAVTADRFACFGCSLLGAQDTLYTGGAGAGLRSYFRGGRINGSCDTIFGGSSSVFEGVALSMRTTVTAPRGEPASAYLFLGGTLEGAGILLGRPWGQLSAVIFKNVSMSSAVLPEGWNDWGHGCTDGLSQWCAPLTFAEFQSKGPGGAPGKRVKWARELTPPQAAAWNVTGVLRGWNPVALLRGDAARAVQLLLSS
jgi:pectinesterase